MIVTEEPKVPTRIVVCSANRYGKILVLGARHGDSLMVAQIHAYQQVGLITRTQCHGDDQGFVDQWGVYMNRQEALAVAHAAGQIGRWRPKHPGDDWLCSEDLY